MLQLGLDLIPGLGTPYAMGQPKKKKRRRKGMRKGGGGGEGEAAAAVMQQLDTKVHILYDSSCTKCSEITNP